MLEGVGGVELFLLTGGGVSATVVPLAPPYGWHLHASTPARRFADCATPLQPPQHPLSQSVSLQRCSSHDGAADASLQKPF